jgi:predicted GTPase
MSETPDDTVATEDAPVAGEPADATADETSTRRAPRDPLANQVLRLANRVHASTREWQRSDLAERITAEADQWNQQHLVVVACGDIKRGKSSLLNAILDRSDLLPVDADVATSVHLVIRYADELGIVVTRIDDRGEPTQEHVGIEQLIDVASMRGNAARREGVSAVEIGLPHPVLERGVVLIDTPGVGGMSRGHRDLALAALGQADALLFTVSAEEPVARSELEFLVEASERTERIIMVVTKSDANSEAGNGEMIAEHRAKLRTYTDTMQSRVESGAVDSEVPVRLRRLHDAPFVLTSSFLAEQARARREAGREEQAERLMARSGIDELRTLLERSADNRDLIRIANLIALLRVLLADVERETQARIRAATGDSKVAEEISERQRGLEEFGSKQARWRTTLNNSIVRLQTSSSRLVTHELNRVKEHYRDVIDATEDGDVLMASLPGELERSLHGAWNELVQAINSDFRSTLGKLLADFGADGMDVVLGEIEMPDGLRELAGARTSHRPDNSLLDDGLPMAMQTYTFANIANAAAGALGLATGGLGLVAYGIGAALAVPLGQDAQEVAREAAGEGRSCTAIWATCCSARKVWPRSSPPSSRCASSICASRWRCSWSSASPSAASNSNVSTANCRACCAPRAASVRKPSAPARPRMAEVTKLRAEIEPLQKAIDQRLADAAATAGTHVTP